jgi:hypothetical protein
VQPSGMMSELDRDGNEVGVEAPQPGASWFVRNRTLLIGVAVVLGFVAIGFQVIRRGKSSGLPSA